MSRQRKRWGSIHLLGLLALAACQKGSLASLSIRLLVSGAGSGGACAASEGDLPLLEGLPSVTRIRVTYRDPTTGETLCDAVVEAGASASAVLGVPEGEAVVDLLVEAFDEAGVLLASGAAFAVDPQSGGNAAILLARSAIFSCAPAPLLFGRAFHSATALPNGEVLIVGGLVADPGDPAAHEVSPDVTVDGTITGGLYATNSVEIYDPTSGTLARYENGEITARAFHEAYLLSSFGTSGGYQILLLGGLRVAGDPSQAPVADMVRDGNEPLPLSPAPDAIGAPAEILTYLPSERRLSRREVSGTEAPLVRTLPSLSHAPGVADPVAQVPPLAAGGFITWPAAPALSFEGIDAGTGSTLGETPLFSAVDEQTRVGATVTWMGDDRVLVFGGNLRSPAGAEAAQAGIVISGVQGGAPASAQMLLDAASAPPLSRAGHTATSVGAAEILIAGGFQVVAGAAVDPATPFAQRVSFAGPSQNPPATFAAVAGTPAPTLVGYHDAVSLSPGVVLLAGGRGTSGASGQALRYQDGALSLVPSEMVVARYGHRLTRLADGGVLVTGGLSVGLGTSTSTVSAVELYNPRTTADDPRPPGQTAGPACPLVR